MAPIVPNPTKIKAFKTEAAFDSWMRANHARETEIWVRIYKKGSGNPTVTAAQALDVALCWGWIDGIRKGFDGESFLLDSGRQRIRRNLRVDGNDGSDDGDGDRKRCSRSHELSLVGRMLSPMIRPRQSCLLLWIALVACGPTAFAHILAEFFQSK